MKFVNNSFSICKLSLNFSTTAQVTVSACFALAVSANTYVLKTTTKEISRKIFQWKPHTQIVSKTSFQSLKARMKPRFNPRSPTKNLQWKNQEFIRQLIKYHFFLSGKIIRMTIHIHNQKRYKFNYIDRNKDFRPMIILFSAVHPIKLIFWILKTPTKEKK